MSGKEIKVNVQASGRHVHLCQSDLDILFGEGYILEKKKPLGGDFLSTSKVEVIGKDGKSCLCSILGPCRNISQVEFSITEARAIGLNPPLGDSGKNENYAPVTLKGPKGTVYLEQGIFVAKRHVHLCWNHAQALGVTEGDSLDLRIDSERPTVFKDVKVRIIPKEAPVHDSDVHLDYDEYNASEAFRSGIGYVTKGE